MNNQEAFSAIWNRFVVHKAPFSVVGDSGEEVMPMYRIGLDISSPIGYIMSDEDYSEELEGRGIDGIYKMLPSLQGVQQELLLSIQLAYDESATDYATGISTEEKARKFFEHSLKKKISSQFGLKIPRRK